ncbi:thioredoxin [Microbacterium sp. SYP-A9085]|uniref:thioredoxin family protein n=1 Tax=Microbacterium sp. SYP-A9085 TaxID=2664454 RepID=UPI00129AEF6F|nr:thioredoxin family protein [Microbacterium sp. SYP-A9085]MRH29262.1 thioredoxin [Microbacterium sp. SYP-A9085]
MPAWIAVLAVTGLIAVTLAAGWALHRRDGRARTVDADAAEPTLVDSQLRGANATLVQFSTQFCTRCPHVRRMLGAIADATDGVAFAEIDLTHRPDLARRLHILQTPTVFVLDGDAYVRTRFTGAPTPRAVTAALDRVIGDPARV